MLKAGLEKAHMTKKRLPIVITNLFSRYSGKYDLALILKETVLENKSFGKFLHKSIVSHRKFITTKTQRHEEIKINNPNGIFDLKYFISVYPFLSKLSILRAFVPSW